MDEEESMKIAFPCRPSALGAVVLAAISLAGPRLADAGVNFTSGKVYMQQKVYDKACHFLELARREEPDNVQVYSLLAVARNHQRQFASSGAVFQLGIKVATDKKEKDKLKDMQQNRESLTAELYNPGVRALSRAGEIREQDNRTTDAGTPQAAVEKERGEPKEFSRFTEGGKAQEFWYYPEQNLGFHFPPGSTEPIQFVYKPFTGPAEPAVAVTDTTIFPPYAGASVVAEAAYQFEMAMLVNPTTSDVFKNLSYVYGVMGRPDDAIHAAQMGLKIKPGDDQLMRNLRAAALGRGNRLFESKRYVEAVPAYRAAIAYDSAGVVTYLSRIAESYQLAALRAKDGPERTALNDSAAAVYMEVVGRAPADSLGMATRENSMYNAAVIKVNQSKYDDAVKILDEGMKTFPKSKDIVLLAGQTKYQVNDFNGSVAAMRQALEIDPKDPTAHQFLFLALNKLDKKDESVAEYTVYRALTDGKPRTGSMLKKWVDSAANRLPPGQQVTKTVTTDGYPEEVRTYTDSDKVLESFFYWTKGVSITFLDGQVFSKATFPPAKM
jgi:tetratricopeptide (TPR) repeat protein